MNHKMKKKSRNIRIFSYEWKDPAEEVKAESSKRVEKKAIFYTFWEEHIGIEWYNFSF